MKKSDNQNQPLWLGVTVIDYASLRRALKAGAKFRAPVLCGSFSYNLDVFEDDNGGLWAFRKRLKKEKIIVNSKEKWVSTSIYVNDIHKVVCLNGFFGYKPQTMSEEDFLNLTK